MRYSSREILDITEAVLFNKTLIANDVEHIEYDTRKLFSSETPFF